jgi:hypothetical protein
LLFHDFFYWLLIYLIARKIYSAATIQTVFLFGDIAQTRESMLHFLCLYYFIFRCPYHGIAHKQDSSVDDLNRIRKRLFYFANLMTRYTLQMLNDDCGGSSEYTYYFTTIRQVCD